MLQGICIKPFFESSGKEHLEPYERICYMLQKWEEVFFSHHGLRPLLSAEFSSLYAENPDAWLVLLVNTSPLTENCFQDAFPIDYVSPDRWVIYNPSQMMRMNSATSVMHVFRPRGKDATSEPPTAPAGLTGLPSA